MKNIIFELIKSKNKCKHKNALIYQNEGYCPDCGQYLVKNYYLVRCSRCDIKREAKLEWGEIAPKEKYCTNCGEEHFYIEKLETISFIDSKYAIYLKENIESKNNSHPNMQVWAEENVPVKKLSVNN